MQFDWWTFALQCLNFVVLVWLLRRFLYRPVRQVIAERRTLVEEAFEEAERQEHEAQASKTEHELAAKRLEQDRHELLRTLHEETQREREAVLREAEAEARSLLDSAQEKIVRERAAALEDAQDQILLLAGELAGKLLSPLESKHLNGAILDGLVERVNLLPEGEKQGLIYGDAEGVAPPMIITAAPLSEDERREWAARVKSAIDCEGGFEFRVDPEILGGAEIAFQHAVISFSWADQLKQARDLLKSS